MPRPSKAAVRPKSAASKASAAPAPLGGRREVDVHESVGLYLDEIARYPRLTRDDEARLSARALEGDEEAQLNLVTSNLKLVVSICKDFTRSNFALLDLVSAGNEGLMVASRKYDWKMGVPFANYAAYWIKQRVMKYIAEHGFTVRVPPYRAPIVNKVVRTHTKLTAQLGRGPTDAEISEVTGCSIAEVGEVLRMMQPAIELDATLRDGDGSATYGSYFGETVAEADDRVTSTLRQMEVTAAIAEATATLPDRERQVLEWYFGLAGQPALELDEIAGRLGVTRERARQIKAAALRRLQGNETLRTCADA